MAPTIKENSIGQIWKAVELIRGNLETLNDSDNTLRKVTLENSQSILKWSQDTREKLGEISEKLQVLSEDFEIAKKWSMEIDEFKDEADSNITLHGTTIADVISKFKTLNMAGIVYGIVILITLILAIIK